MKGFLAGQKVPPLTSSEQKRTHLTRQASVQGQTDSSKPARKGAIKTLTDAGMRVKSDRKHVSFDLEKNEVFEFDKNVVRSSKSGNNINNKGGNKK